MQRAFWKKLSTAWRYLRLMEVLIPGSVGNSTNGKGSMGEPSLGIQTRVGYTFQPPIVVVVVVDSHIQRIVLATEETTVTQQVSHRPIKRQSRLWSQRGTKVNGSQHGDNPLLRPTGIQIATKSYAALQAMAPTNIKTVHQTSLLHSRATSIDSECCRLPTTSVLSKKPEKLRSNQF